MPLRHFQPEHYESLFEEKTRAAAKRFAPFNPPPPQYYRSDERHFRMRAEFSIWHSDGQPHYVMFDPAKPREPLIVDEFPLACRPIADLMRPLMAALRRTEELSRRLFQVEFLSGLSGELLVTLIYHRPLGNEWSEQARELEREFSIAVIGRSRKQREVLSRDYITETLNADGRAFRFKHVENSFTQPNARVNEQMIDWVCRQAGSHNDDLLELYCGCGNFTIPLARHFSRVLATEVSKTSVRAAQENCALNETNNVDVVRLSAEEISTALKGLRPFRRLSHLDLGQFSLNSVFVDPPRAGLDDFTRDFVSSFETIFYVSCNPDTLLRDLWTLTRNHHITALAFFDQFPYTPHLECGVVLTRQTS